MFYDDLDEVTILNWTLVKLCGNCPVSVYCLSIEMLRRVRLFTSIAGAECSLGIILRLRSRQHMDSLLYSHDWD